MRQKIIHENMLHIFNLIMKKSPSNTHQESLCVISALYMQVGDPQEVNGIVGVFCQSKREPLLIGSTKSNMGHPEPASGMAALAKVRVTHILLLSTLKIQNHNMLFHFFFFFPFAT